ncbi:hypothetical protein [Altererythrobacter epoxidivorans]|uniref:hypothetical protein n=1 Tax=Altererythrobacter epoxidivorans TaxID=361183 RepID=UPI0007825B09|nr:hypothetical protein [Altererythrobacter epoxidivorans]
MRRTILLACAALCITACSAPEEGADGSVVTEDTTDVAAATEDNAGDTGGSDETPPADLERTAWRVDGEDGAVYTTYLDDDGTYRDFKNGEPLQSGTWEEVSAGRICFEPAEDDKRGECWDNEALAKDGTMRTTSDSDKTVELRRVTYVGPNE